MNTPRGNLLREKLTIWTQLLKNAFSERGLFSITFGLYSFVQEFFTGRILPFSQLKLIECSGYVIKWQAIITFSSLFRIFLAIFHLIKWQSFLNFPRMIVQKKNQKMFQMHVTNRKLIFPNHSFLSQIYYLKDSLKNDQIMYLNQFQQLNIFIFF